MIAGIVAASVAMPMPQQPKLNPTKTFTPLPWQIAAWRDQSPVVLLTGSAGGGKSKLAAEKLNAYCLKYPGSMALMIRHTRQSMQNSTVLFMDRKIVNREKVRHIYSRNRFEYENGSILAYGGMADEEQREQIRSIGQDGSIDIAWMEEATRFKEIDYSELRARMRGKAAPWRQIILTTNPDNPFHWVYKRLILGGESKVYYSGAVDNPYNPEDYRATLASLPGILGQRLRDGKWVQAEGAVFSEFDSEIHVIDRFEIPKEWPRYRSIDFGYVNPFVCQWWAQDSDGRLYMYREVYQTERIVDDLAREIVELSKNEAVEYTVADHDAEDRATLEAHDIVTMPANKGVRAGIQVVQRRLRKAGDGKPRLFFFRDALVSRDQKLDAAKKPCSTIEEIPGYVWDVGRKSEDAQEQPIKQADHGCDSARYLVSQLDSDETSFSMSF